MENVAVLSVVGAVTGIISLVISVTIWFKVRRLTKNNGVTQYKQYYNQKLGIFVDRKEDADRDQATLDLPRHSD